MTEFIEMSTWYIDSTGEEVLFHSLLQDGETALVQELLERPDSDYLVGKLFTISTKRLVKTPSVHKLHEKAKQLQTDIAELTKQYTELEREHDDLVHTLNSYEKEHAERIKKYKQYSALSQLDDFIDGKITHFVLIQYNIPKIVTFKEHMEYAESRWSTSRKLRLLTLYGDSKGNLAWITNSYSDGSGNTVHVKPCCSLEEALRIVQDYVNDMTKTEDPRDDDTVYNLYEEYNKFDIVIPQILKDRVQKIEQTRLEKSYTRALDTLDAATKAFNEISAKMKENNDVLSTM